MKEVEAVYFKHVKGNIFFFFKNEITKKRTTFHTEELLLSFAEVIYTGLEMKTLQSKWNSSSHTTQRKIVTSIIIVVLFLFFLSAFT